MITAVSGTAGSLVTVTTRGAFTSASIADTIALVNALATRYEDTSSWVREQGDYRTIEQQMVGTGAVKAIEMTNGKSCSTCRWCRSSTMLSRDHLGQPSSPCWATSPSTSCTTASG